MDFLEQLSDSHITDDGPVFQNLWNEYQKIILRSLVTTFGLDFLIKDQFGGDVDTIHNVRKGVPYKNAQNEQNYLNRGEYDKDSLHHDSRFSKYKKEVKNKQEFIDDQYSPGKKIYLGKSSYLKKNNMVAECDHCVSGHEVHDDPGRVLAGLETNDLANRPENFYFTNSKLNRDMSDTSKAEYVKQHADSLSESEKEAILNADKRARKSIDGSINHAYYTKDSFYIDSINAAHKLGVNMGFREALGFIMVELFFSCKQEIEKMPDNIQFADCLRALKIGIEKGIKNIKLNYKFIFAAFGEGYISGVLASLSTTLINVFITTDKVAVKNIRTISITLVRASNVLLLNPGQLFLGDRLKSTLVILSTGVSTVFGTTVGTCMERTPIQAIPVIGPKTTEFIQILVSGLLSCTFLFMLDRSALITSLVDKFNNYAPAGYSIHQYCDYYERLASELGGYGIDEYARKCREIDEKVSNICCFDDEEQMANALDSFDINDDIDSFLDGKTSDLKI